MSAPVLKNKENIQGVIAEIIFALMESFLFAFASLVTQPNQPSEIMEDYNRQYMQNEIMESQLPSLLVTDAEKDSHSALTAIAISDDEYKTPSIINDVNNLNIVDEINEKQGTTIEIYINNANNAYCSSGYESTDNLNRLLMIDTCDSEIDYNQYGNEALLFVNKYFKDWNIKILKYIGSNRIVCTFGKLDKCHYIYYIISPAIVSVFMNHVYKHHQLKLKNKYSIVQKQTKQYLFITDQKKLNKKINKLNRKINKYQSHKYNNLNKKRSSINISKSHTKYLTYNDYCDAETDSNNSNSFYTNISSTATDISNSNSDSESNNKNIHKKHIKHSHKKRSKHHSDSLRMDNRCDVKKRNRSNSTHTYTEYRANNNVNKIDVEKWQDIKSADEEELIKKQQSLNRYHFVRSNHSHIHQLTPTNTKKNISNNQPLYSRGSGHQTNVTTPNPTSSSTDRFKYKIKHQHKTSYGNLIAIERSIGPTTSPKHSQCSKVSPKQSPKLNKYECDMLTGNSIHSINVEPRNIIRQIPRKPSLPPKIIKLDSPSVTVNGNLSSSDSEKGQEPMQQQQQQQIQVIHKQRRSFQITRRPLSPPSKPQPQPRVLNMPLISNTHTHTTVLSFDDKGHPINEYDPLDLNDSAVVKPITYPVLSEKNLSLHQHHLSNKNKSLQDMMDLSGSGGDFGHTKDLSGSGSGLIGHSKDLSGSSGLILQNIVKNHTLLRAPENMSDSNFTSNSKAVVLINPSHSNENTKSNDNENDNSIHSSALDILKIRQNNNNNNNNNLNVNMNNECDIEHSIRSSVISLENILQERGLFKKTDVKILRDVELDKEYKSKTPSPKSNQKQTQVPLKIQVTREVSNTNRHQYTNTDSIDDSTSLLEHILEYQTDGINNNNNSNNNNCVIHGIIPDDEESKFEESNDFIVKSPSKDTYSYDENMDDIGMYAQLDPNLLLNNPSIQIRHVHNNKKKKRKTIHNIAGRTSAFSFDNNETNKLQSESSNSNNNITPISVTDIHYNIQQQVKQMDNKSMSQSEIIDPLNNININSPPSTSMTLPITSPYKQTQQTHKHYFHGSSNLHNNKRRSLYNNNNNNNIVIDTDEDQSSLSALSPNNNSPIVSNNQSGQLNNTFSSNRNNNNQLYVNDNSSAESTPNEVTRQNGNVCDGRTSTY